MTSFNLVKTCYSNLFLDSIEKIHVFLTDKAIGSAMPFNGTLIVKTSDKQFKTIDMTEMNPTDFISVASIANATDKIMEMITKYNQLTTIKDYNINVLTQGQTIEIPYSDEKIAFLVVSDKRGQYFDFEVRWPATSVKESGKVISYSNKNTINGLLHSGDIGTLLHCVTTNKLTNDPFVLDVVGYRKTPLRQFINQHPAVILVNHQTKTLYIVPCPLDKITMQENSFAGLVVGKRTGNMIRYTVLPSPSTLMNVNTGTVTASIDMTIANAIEQFNEIMNEPVLDLTEFDEEPVFELQLVEDEHDTESVVELPTIPYLQFVEEGVAKSTMIQSNNGFTFGTGLEYVDNVDVTTPLPPVRLNPFGESKGPVILALSTGYSGQIPLTMESYHEMIEKSNLVTTILSDKWNEEVIKASSTLINGIFIIKCGNFPGKGARDKFMNDVNIAGISAMAGPNSIVLMDIGDNLFWYRGVRYPGLIDNVPIFGTDVTDLMHPNILKALAESGYKTPFPTIYNKGCLDVYWAPEGKMMKPNDVAEITSKLSIDDINVYAPDIADCLTQFQIIFDPDQLQNITNRMVKSLNKMVEDNIKEFRDEFSKMFEQGLSLNDDRVKECLANLKGAKRKTNRLVQPLINKLGQLISLQGSSKRSFNLKQMMRKAKIYSNVDKAKNMTMEEKMDLLDASCEELGVLLSCVNSEVLPHALKAVSDKNYLTFANSNIENDLMGINNRTLYLDACTTGAMLEISESDEQYRYHPLATVKPGGIAMPQGIDYEQQGISCVPFVLNDKYVNSTDPSTIYPTSVCNDDEFSMFRIMLRGTIADSKASREFNFPPQSKDLGYLLVDMILCTMESLSNQFSDYPKVNDDFSNTTCQIMRGLFGQLLTVLASGQKPLSMAWQLVMHDPNLEIPDDNEWWIYIRLLKMFPYTCWDPSDLIKNIKTLLVRIVRKKIINKVIEPMLKEISKIKAQSQKDNVEARNRELKFVKLAIDVLCTIVNDELQTDQNVIQIAKRLLEKVPEMNAKGGTEQIINFFEHVAKKKVVKNVDWSKLEPTMQIALNIFTKRSATFKNFKKTMVKVVEKGKEDRIEKYVSEYNKYKASLQEKYMADTIKVQNESAIKGHDVNGLKSDAEINRTPWSITDEEIDLNEHNRILSWILTGTAGTTVGTTEVSDSKDMISKEEPMDDVKKAIVGCPKNDRALALYDLCQTKNVKRPLRKLIPLSAMEDMLNFVGIAPKKQDYVMAMIMSEFLKNWRKDGIETESYVVNMI